MLHVHFITLILAALGTVEEPSGLTAEKVTQRIDLIDTLKRQDVEYHLNPDSKFDVPPEKVWVVEGSQLHITGNAFGYAATKASYRDYQMVVEYRWGEHTWGTRKDKARDNGFFIHGHGPHGFMNGSWMQSIEAQIIEGGTGDLLVIAPRGQQSLEASSLKSEHGLDRDGEKIWRAGSPLQQVTSGRINWRDRDEDWKDVKNFRGTKDLEHPVGDWNRFEVVAEGGSLRVFLNGVLVNEASEVFPPGGRILSTCLGAEIFVRRWELLPLNESK